MRRPAEIVWFERLMLVTLALGLLHGVLLVPTSRFGVGPALALIVPSIVVFALFVSLTLLVSRRRSSVAKWLLIALMALVLAISIRQLVSSLFFGILVITLAQTLGQFLALALLFTSTSRRWFRREQPQA